MKNLKSVLVLIILLVAAGYTAFLFNLAGLQDIYYGSKYFRPYAHLKKEPEAGNVIQLKDGKILLLGYEHSELFDPATKRSELIAGLHSIQGRFDWTRSLNLLSLKNGDVLITNGAYINGGSVNCWNGYHKFCYPNGQQRTPLYRVAAKRFEWIPFPLRYLKGHTVTLLPSGDVLLVGGVDGFPKYNARIAFHLSFPNPETLVQQFNEQRFLKEFNQ